MKGRVIGKRSEAGTSLIDILFSLAILGLGTTIFIQYSKTIIANRGEAELIRQKSVITTMLINGTNCEKTVACKSSEYVDLQDYNGQITVKADRSSTYGPWHVQAQCQPDKTLTVTVTAPSPAKGGFRLDPLTGKKLDGSNKSDAILQAGALCGTLDKTPGVAPISLLRSAHCSVNQGTCPPPTEALAFPDDIKQMCCEDGRDVPKPLCKAPAKELGSYWDREGNWGAEGSWVVFCE